MRPRPANTIAVSNPRYGNRKCNTHDQWLEHRPATVAPLNTVLQPILKKTKSFSSVTSPKDMTKSAKYCLMTQNQDQNGDIETQFFKVFYTHIYNNILQNQTNASSVKLFFLYLLQSSTY